MKSKSSGFQCSLGLNFKKSWLILTVIAVLSCLGSAGAQPPPPQNVQGAWIYSGWLGAESFARLTWDAAPGATSYRVFVLDTNANNWNLVSSSVTGHVFFDFYQGPRPATYAVASVGPDG